MVAKHVLRVEQHQEAHLVRGYRELILPAIDSDFSPQISLSLVEFPVNLSPGELGQVVLLVDAHAMSYLGRQRDDVDSVATLTLLGRVSRLVGPVSCGKHFDVQVQVNGVRKRRLSEVLHPLLRHLDVSEHDFESLGEIEATLLFELLNDLLLGIFEDPPLVEQALGKVVLVEALEDVLVLQVSENVDNLIHLVRDLDFSVVLKLLFELVIQIHHETLGRLLILVDEALESVHDSQLDSTVPLQSLGVEVKDLLSKLDNLLDQLLTRDTFVLNQFDTFASDVSLELILHFGEGLRTPLEKTVHQLHLVELLLLEHVKEAAILHLEKGGGVDFDEFSQELLEDFVLRAGVQVGQDTLLLLTKSRVGLDEEVVARVLSDELVAFVPVVVSSLGDEVSLEFLLVDLLGLHSNFNEHLDHLLHVDPFNGLTVAFPLDL